MIVTILSLPLYPSSPCVHSKWTEKQRKKEIKTDKMVIEKNKYECEYDEHNEYK